jgi:hypothetical protein
MRIPSVTRPAVAPAEPFPGPQPAEDVLHPDLHQLVAERAVSKIDVTVGQHPRQHFPENLQTLVA